MDATAMKLVNGTTAQICEGFDLEEEAAKLASEGKLDLQASPREFLDQLLGHELFPDAMRFLSYALPKREAVWWSCLCVRAAVEGAEELSCLQLAERWTRDPVEENRRAAMQEAERVEFSTPDAWSAVGAFWSGGSMAPPEAPVVPPSEGLTAHAVSGAVLLAAVHSKPELAPQRYRSFASLAVDLSNGHSRWDSPPTSPDAGTQR